MGRRLAKALALPGKAFQRNVVLWYLGVFRLCDCGLSAGGWLSFAIMPPEEFPAFALTLHRLEAESGLVERRERRTLIVER